MPKKHAPLTSEEQRAIASLRRLAARWPASLWLFSNGTMNVLKKGPDGRQYTQRGGTDPDYLVTTIDLPNDGGDW